MVEKRTVRVKDYLHIYDEYVAQEAITPGMIVELRSDGKVQKHSGEGEDVLPMFAMEDNLQGKTVDQAYAEDDPCHVWIPQRGDQVYALLDDDETVVVGDFLVSAGNGRLKKYEVESSSIMPYLYQERIVGQALYAVDLKSSTGTWPSTGRRIIIRVI